MSLAVRTACAAVLTMLLGIEAVAQSTNRSVRFDGATAYGSAGGVGGLVSNSTWEAWIRVSPNATGTGGSVVQRWGMYSHGIFVDWAQGSTGVDMYSCWSNPCAQQNSPPGSIQRGQWYHIALVYGPESGPSCQCYLNGQLVAQCASQACAPYAGWETVLGAAGYIGYNNLFHGDIDEVRISNISRYTAPFTPALRHVPDGNTVGLWHFDEGTGSTASDASGNGLHFNLHGGYQWVDGASNIQADFQLVGTGCPGSAGIPALGNVAGSLPRMGNSLQLRLTNLPMVATVCVPFFGFNNQSAGGMPLPMSLANYGMPGCLLYTDVFGSTFVIGTAGSANWSVPIPSQATMLGTHFYLQSLVFDAGANNPAQRTISNAADATVGG